jgi:FMN phosphatase YigB (HAD superfamily)
MIIFDFDQTLVDTQPVEDLRAARKWAAAQRCRFRDFQGIHYECGPVLPRFFIEPSTLNHFTPFWRFEKFGYSHLSAARF